MIDIEAIRERNEARLRRAEGSYYLGDKVDVEYYQVNATGDVDELLAEVEKLRAALRLRDDNYALLKQDYTALANYRAGAKTPAKVTAETNAALERVQAHLSAITKEVDSLKWRNLPEMP